MLLAKRCGFVQRRPDPTDRRAHQLVATEAGRALVSTARAALRAAEAELMQDLSTAEQTHLRQLLARVALGAGDGAFCRA